MPSATSLTVAVTGATGFVGRHICRALTAQGHLVRALIRDREKARNTLPTERLTWVIGDVHDGRSPRELLTGCDAVVNTIGIRREIRPESTFARMHPGATRLLIEAAEAEGVSRFIQISALGTRPDAATAYHRSKFESESILRRSSLDWTILRPSLIHGPDGEFMKMTKDWVLGRAAPWFVIPYFLRVEPPKGMPPTPKFVSAKIQPIHVDDVAEAVAAALRHPATIGEVYPLGGSETYDWPTMLIAIRDAIPMSEKKKKTAGIPGHLGAAMAMGAEAIGMGDALPFGPSEPIMATEDNTCAITKAGRHLNFNPRSFITTMKAYAASI